MVDNMVKKFNAIVIPVISNVWLYILMIRSVAGIEILKNNYNIHKSGIYAFLKGIID